MFKTGSGVSRQELSTRCSPAAAPRQPQPMLIFWFALEKVEMIAYRTEFTLVPELRRLLDSDLGRLIPVLQPIAGTNDPSDSLSIEIGFGLWVQHGLALTHAQLVAAVRQAKPEYELAVSNALGEGPIRVRER